MMKLHAPLTAGLAAMFVLPSLSIGADRLRTLEEALGATDRALDVLTGVERTLEKHPANPEVTKLVRSVTEAPMLDAQRRDTRLVELRNQVNLLQTELDMLEGSAFLPSEFAPDPLLAIATPSGGAPDLAPMRNLTTGLDAGMRSLLEPSVPSRFATSEEEPAETKANGTSSMEGDQHAVPAPREEAGYSAAPLEHARACIRVGRFTQALELLGRLEPAGEVLYLSARCLEKLGRLDEALASLDRALELQLSDDERRRAEGLREFLSWKLSFVQSLSQEDAR